MIRHLLFAIAIWLSASVGVLAQTASADSPLPDEAADPLAEWSQVAIRAETVLENGVASTFALNRLRDELFGWREIFDGEREANSSRIATVRSQLDALGAVPDGDEEPTTLAERRAVLEEQLDRLIVPARLAAESFARADGLIGEVDEQVRNRTVTALTTRGPTLLNPTTWASAISGLVTNLSIVGTETSSRVSASFSSGRILSNLPGAVAWLALAFVLLTWGRRSTSDLADKVATSETRGRAAWSFALSVWEVILPAAGLLAVTRALLMLDFVGTFGRALLDGIFYAGVIILIASWLARQFFPDNRPGPINHPLQTHSGLRRSTILLGWGMALLTLLDVALNVTDLGASQKAAVSFPVQVFLSFVLFQFGRALRQRPEPSEMMVSAGRTRSTIGTLAMAVAVLAPLLAVSGFSAASNQLFVPSVTTLAVIGTLVLLQRLVHDLWLIWTDPDQGESALAPVLIGFGLFLLSLPVLALIWGASVAELREIWARFQLGFAIGETTLSPTDFIVFVAVFLAGYLITRLTQTGLRQSVLPRTRLDVGGQDAVVAGVGYIGIILAAIAAITAAGVDLSNIALVAGALSVGIGFGLQTVVSNFVSGIILLIERPVSAGDWIEVNGQMGIVKDISVRSTRIETFDRTDVIIPNADLISGQVTNWTRGNSIGRVIVPVGVAYGTDVQKVKDILLDVATSHPLVLLDPPPAVFFQNFGDSSLDFEVRAILRDVNFVLGVKSDMNTEIEKRFAEEGIEIPYPQRDIWMRNSENGDT